MEHAQALLKILYHWFLVISRARKRFSLVSGVVLGMTVGKLALQLFQTNPCDHSYVTSNEGARHWANVLVGHHPALWQSVGPLGGSGA